MVGEANALDVRCRFCSWAGMVRAGWRYNRRTRKQRYRCRLCRRRFVADDGFVKYGHRPETVTKALDLYFSGLGSWKVVGYLGRHEGTRISRMSVVRWARRFGRLVYEFLRCLTVHPRGRNLHCDEKRPKVGRREVYFWIMALGTPHFVVAADLTRDKGWDRPKALFREVRGRLLEPVPKVVTDGLGAYNSWTGMAPSRTPHVVVESFEAWPNNNRIERLNGSVTDWLTRRGLHRMDSARDLLLGWTVHQTYVHRHSRLDVTPAEANGLRLGLDGDAWRGLIGMATKSYPD
jgi:transposase-like protein